MSGEGTSTFELMAAVTECWKRGDYEAAEERCAALLREDHSAWALVKRAEIRKARGSAEEACIADCTDAIALNPDYASAYRVRGVLLTDRKDWKAAKRDIDLAQKLDFDLSTVQLQRTIDDNIHKSPPSPRRFGRSPSGSEDDGLCSEKESMSGMAGGEQDEEWYDDALDEDVPPDDDTPESRRDGSTVRSCAEGELQREAFPALDIQQMLVGLMANPELMAALSNTDVLKKAQELASQTQK